MPIAATSWPIRLLLSSARRDPAAAPTLVHVAMRRASLGCSTITPSPYPTGPATTGSIPCPISSPTPRSGYYSSFRASTRRCGGSLPCRVIAALEGADVTLVGYDGIKRVSDSAKEIKTRFNIDARAADGSDDDKKSAILAETEVALCAGRAGIQILSSAQLAAAKRLLIVADVNAVPPAGVEGLDMLDMQANGIEIGASGAMGFGPLTIGNIKYKTEFGLFQKMISATRPTHFDFRGAFAPTQWVIMPRSRRALATPWQRRRGHRSQKS